MTTLENRIKSSIVSGIIEVLATHPLDYAKTLVQNNNKSLTLDQFLKKPYKGMGSRLLGIVPMRVIFWNSLTYFKNKNYNPITAGMLTAIIQTTIDYPIEQIKIQKMISDSSLKNAFYKPGLIPGFFTTLGRNTGFAMILNGIISRNEKSYYHAAIGGFVGAVATQPLDSLKTWYQVGNSNYPKNWTLNDYYRGWYFRAGISLVSMNVGWLIFNKINDYYSKIQ